jgi:Fic family protein
LKNLLDEYNHIKKKSFEDILDFHVRFEQIHPFQDGNGRVGRLLPEGRKNGYLSRHELQQP